MTKNKLGKNLNSIIGSDISAMLEEIQQGKGERASKPLEVSIHSIRPNPYQPRKVFDSRALEELADSISKHGVFTPVLIRESASGYELIAGERRLRASQLAHKTTIPAIIVDFDDQQMMEISLLENIQRENLSAIEEARAYENLIHELHYTQEQLAGRIGKSREHVSNTMRLLKLPESVQSMVIEHKLTMGHVRPLLALKNAAEMESMAEKILEKNWSVRATEQAVKNQLRKQPPMKIQPELSPEARSVLEDFFQGRVELKEGSLQIFISKEQAEEAAARLQHLTFLE